MIDLGRKLLKRMGIDGAIAFTILTRLIQGFGGVVSIVFIAKYLLPQEQGYYYTFASIIAIQIFFELGLSTILTQYAAHEFAHLSWSKTGELIGEDIYKSRLSSLLRFCVRWFGLISIVLFFLLIAVGFFFFSNYNATNNIEWKNPWIILALSTSLNLFIDPILAIFDGLGEVKDMAKVRLIQKSMNVILVFVLLALGFKLYAGAIASLISILINYVQILFSKRIVLLKKVWFEKKTEVVNYYDEIFPYQWRIAVSWISGYFIFQLFNPVLFATEGSVVAGQMGMTMQAFNGIAGISISWMSTKIPLFSTLISKREFSRLDTSFNQALQNQIIFNVVLLCIFTLSIIGLGYFPTGLRNRFLPTFPLICLSVTVLINQIINSWAVYLRCHKKEPLLIQAVISAVYCTFSTLIFGKYWGLKGIVFGYTAWSVISYFWISKIFKNKKIEWHTDANVRIVTT